MVEQATEIRRRVLTAFEQAERETNPEEQKQLLTFVVVGGGPTGVELAGAIGEMSRFTLARDFRSIDAKLSRVILIEAGPRILPTFSAKVMRGFRKRHRRSQAIPCPWRITYNSGGDLTLTGNVRCRTEFQAPLSLAEVRFPGMPADGHHRSAFRKCTGHSNSSFHNSASVTAYWIDRTSPCGALPLR